MRFFLLLVLALVQLGSYLLFCKGFFPTKVLLSPADLQQFQDGSFVAEKPPQMFDRLVFMVVDACRADFMFSNSSYMHFTHKLLNSGVALGFTAYSNPPTVTLPRLKGITTGSTPSFIDAVLNIAEEDTSSSLGDQDSWIKQLYMNNWKINMFGDDTWLKLFPSYFEKTDGTASFYVSDFTIVDQNVTRHLDYELSTEGQSHWDALILHYLGLDHIGHKGGPLSSNMPSKQMEMDGIIEQIFENLVKDNEDTLFVVMGDHGMNEVGNHGGSSLGETSPGLMLISSKFANNNNALDGNNGIIAPIELDLDYNYYTRIDQIDLVPTLATLLGVDIPINSLGNFITSLLPLYSGADQSKILLNNLIQLKVLIDKKNGYISRINSIVEDLTDKEQMIKYISLAKEELSRSSSDYNYDDIYKGILLYAFTAVVIIIWYFIHYGKPNRENVFTIFSNLTWFVIYGTSFFGSSLIEEEHHIWWWFTTIYITFNLLKSYYYQSKSRRTKVNFASLIFLGIGMRILKGWNNSGQKNNLKSNTKIQTFLTQDLNEHQAPIAITALLAVTCLYFCLIAYTSFDDFGISFTTFMPISVCAVQVFSVKFLSFIAESYDLETGSVQLPDWCTFFMNWNMAVTQHTDLPSTINYLIRFFYAIFIPTLVMFLLKPVLLKAIPYLKKELSSANNPPNFNYFKTLLCLISMLLMIQTNFSNVPIFGALLLIQNTLPNIVNIDKSTVTTLANFSLLLQNLSFFQFGSTNTLSSVDLTNSFNGLTSYNMVLVGVLTFISNWASPIFWSLSFLQLSNDNLNLINSSKLKINKWDLLFEKLIFNFTFYSIGGLCLMLSCYNLRFHLFIWTVFSPKILYFLAWYVMNLVIDFFLSYLLTLLYV